MGFYVFCPKCYGKMEYDEGIHILITIVEKDEPKGLHVEERTFNKDCLDKWLKDPIVRFDRT